MPISLDFHHRCTVRARHAVEGFMSVETVLAKRVTQLIQLVVLNTKHSALS